MKYFSVYPKADCVGLGCTPCGLLNANRLRLLFREDYKKWSMIYLWLRAPDAQLSLPDQQAWCGLKSVRRTTSLPILNHLSNRLQPLSRLC